MQILRPDWPAPQNVHACSTTRTGGHSQGAWASLNLGDHVGDDPRHVSDNRRLLCETLQLPAEPLWLRQEHGITVLEGQAGCADASVSFVPGQVCVVLAADCLPLLLCDRDGSVVAAVHAGWRGLLAGVIEAALKRMHRPAGDLLVWLGPAIGPRNFLVGSEVRDAFLDEDPLSASAFAVQREHFWYADLYALARQRLHRYGVHAVYGGGFCTVEDSRNFFSYRRDGVSGRMASLIWLAL